jgi:hypothetical protein
MKDAVLHLEGYLPNGGGTVNLSPMDLNVDTNAFSDNWRQGRLRVALNANLPNFTNAANSITVSLTDSGDGGATFQQTNPLIQASFPGVANTGAVAAYVDVPLYPGLRGPIGVAIVVGAGNNVLDPNGNPVLVTIDWMNE